MKMFEIGPICSMTILIGLPVTAFMLLIGFLAIYSNYNSQQEIMSKIQVCQQMTTDQNRSNCLDELK